MPDLKRYIRLTYYASFAGIASSIGNHALATNGDAAGLKLDSY